MAAALGVDRERLLLDPSPGPPPERFAEFVERRLAGEPVAYITGHRAFWTIDLEVGPGALIPRPDSETLIAAAVEHFAGGAGPRRILDLGTGPGTLLLAALDQWPEATGLGIERSTAALAYAERNARRLGLDGRAELRRGDWARDGWARAIGERFDLVLVNPPYVARGAALGAGVTEHEPGEALFAGADGLDDYRLLAPELGGLIAAGGMAAVEIGFDQAGAVTELLARAGLRATLARDLGGRPRVLTVQAP